MLKQQWRGIIFLLGILLISLPAFAALDKSLYAAAVPVASQSPEDLQKALPQALRQVLVQVSGDADIINSALIQQQLSQAGNFVQSYSYENNVQDTPPGLTLKVQFDPRGINQLLKITGQAPQPAVQYPPLLVWLAIPAEQVYNVIDSNAQGPIASALRAVAQQQRITVLLPLLDLEDMNTISAEQVWQLNIDLVTQASQRYEIANILLGRISSSTANGQWQGDWILQSPQHTWRWQTAGVTPTAVLQNVFTNIAHSLAPVTPPVQQNSATSQQVKVHISDITGLKQYASAVKYLKSLAQVNHVAAAGVAGDAVILNVTITGDAEALDGAVQNGQVMLPDTLKNNTATELYYRWVGSAE